MNVSELYRLAKWLENFGNTVRSKYQSLASTLNHNATQPDKQPVKEILDDLKQSLNEMPLRQLTSEQMALLDHFELSNIIGEPGAQFVHETVETSDFDPATASSAISGAQSKLNRALDLMNSFVSSFENLKLDGDLEPAGEGRVTVRIQFKNAASMSNVAKWKSWSNEWHDIVRGIALCIDEAPEDIRVTGATSGSIIVALAGTLSFVGVLTLIYRQIAFVIKDGLVIANAIEDLRHKRLLNRQIETALKKQQKELSENGIKSTLEAVKSSLPEKLDGEQETAMTKAIEKLFNFHELGGGVDFVAPPEADETAGNEETQFTLQMNELRQTIEEIRTVRDEIRLLTHQSEKDGE